MGDVELEGTDATCLDPGSRTIGIPGIMGICDGPARPGDLSFGDVTSFESEKQKNKEYFTSLISGEIAFTGNHLYTDTIVMSLSMIGTVIP